MISSLSGSPRRPGPAASTQVAVPALLSASGRENPRSTTSSRAERGTMQLAAQALGHQRLADHDVGRGDQFGEHR